MIPLRLEIFDDAPGPAGSTGIAHDGSLDEARLAAFDDGYRAGWDDANAARAHSAAESEEALVNHLQSLSFTYHDARSHVLRALNPLIAEIAARLLPTIAQSALPQLVVDALAPFAEFAASAPVELRACPATRDLLEARLGGDPGLPLAFVADPALTPGQVWLRLGEAETRVDIDAALTAIRTVLRDFFEPQAKDSNHG